MRGGAPADSIAIAERRAGSVAREVALLLETGEKPTIEVHKRLQGALAARIEPSRSASRPLPVEPIDRP
jgi:hypothetical protein